MAGSCAYSILIFAGLKGARGFGGPRGRGRGHAELLTRERARRARAIVGTATRLDKEREGLDLSRGCVLAEGERAAR